MIEGPKTPPHVGNSSEIRNCFLSQNYSPSCMISRYYSLSRHIQEIQKAIDPTSWKLEWFQVDDPHLSAEDQTQGIHLRAIHANKNPEKSRIQDRIILIGSNGSHQTLILNRFHTKTGDTAYALLLRTVQSLNNFRDLTTGRTWINERLQNIHLEQLKLKKNKNELITELAKIQSLLISKISVDPASFDAYYHLAGTSFLFSTDPRLKELRNHFNTFTNLQSAYRFAQDVAPKNPRILQIESMLKAAKKSLL